MDVLLLAPQMIRCKGDECQMACTLYSYRQTALVFGTRSCLTARANFAPVRQIAPQEIDILVGHFFHFVQAKVADLIAAWSKSTETTSATWTTASTASTTIIK